jgi:hypothetical protein
MTYQLYKPLRNHLRQYPLFQSLAVIRAYAQYLQYNQPFPQDMKVNPAFLTASKAEKGVYEWELELLTRQIILNSPNDAKRDMRTWEHFSSAVNKLKQLENSIAGNPAYRSLFKENILQEIFRMSHRQFHWQQQPNTDDLMRYFKIFGSTELEPILVRELGLNARQLYMLGLGVIALYLDNFGINEPVQVDMKGILDQEHVDRFIGRFSIGIDDLRENIKETQSYDQDFAYTMNPLLVNPLIWITENGRRVLIAPIPTYVLRRFTEGIYYEICNSEGFSDAFGPSFQNYVGEVLSATTRDSAASFLEEETYKVGKIRKDSVDWIMKDDTATLFIECKTKKVRYEAKVALTDTVALNKDLEKMADSVVQVYKTLVDALNGHYNHWQPDDRPIYPMIVNLEEWFAFGDGIVPVIDERVRIKLIEAGMNPELLAQHPYSICSVKDLEYSASVMAQVGILEYMQLKNDEEHRYWSHGSYASSNFYQQMKNRQDLFPDAWTAIHPGL